MAKPTGSLQMNTGNGLATGCVFMWLEDENIVTHTAPDGADTATPTASSSEGLALEDTERQSWLLDGVIDVAASGSVSCYVVMERNGSIFANHTLLGLLDATETGLTYGFGSGGGDAIFCGARRTTTSLWMGDNVSTPAVDGVAHILSFSADAVGSDITRYEDGVKIGTRTNWNGGLERLSETRVVVGTNSSVGCRIIAAGIWNRALTDAEQVALNTDPYQMVEAAATGPTLTGPSSVTEGTSTATVGTGQDTVTTLSIQTTDAAFSVEQTKGATTATGITFTPASGINACGIDAPAAGIPLVPTVSAAGITAYATEIKEV